MENKIDTNPYNSLTYTQEWIKNFDEAGLSKTFNALEGPRFIKTGLLGSYINTTSNLTLQHYYQINNKYLQELNNKLLIIYDVPSYFKIPNEQLSISSRIKRFKVIEYDGYLINLNKCSSIDEYLRERFSSRKKRAQFRSYLKKLEKSFDVSYKMYFGEISLEEYEILMNHFYDLSVKSFVHRRIKNKKLERKNFLFLKSVFYQMINKKEASLYVINDGEVPIGMTLNFNSETTLFSDSTVYDLDYFKFNVGTILMMKQIEWCLKNKIRIYDFSKGHFQYKERWCNNVYKFEHHIIYDSSVVSIGLKAFIIKKLLTLKQYLREHKLRVFLKDNVFNKQRTEINKFNYLEIEKFEWTKGQPIKLKEFPHLKKAYNDFLYYNGERKSQTSIYCLKNKEKIFLIEGSKSKQLVELV